MQTCSKMYKTKCSNKTGIEKFANKLCDWSLCYTIKDTIEFSLESNPGGKKREKSSALQETQDIFTLLTLLRRNWFYA